MSNTMEISEQNETQPNSPIIKTFQTAQKIFATLGIRPSFAMQPYPFNVRILIGSLILGATMICNLLYVLNDAKTFAEYTQCAYYLTTELLVLFYLLVVILKVKNIFEFIDSCDRLVNTSEYRKRISRNPKKPLQ